jgi:hypothetical protein
VPTGASRQRLRLGCRRQQLEQAGERLEQHVAGAAGEGGVTQDGCTTRGGGGRTPTSQP